MIPSMESAADRTHSEEYVRPTGMCPHCGEIVPLTEGDWLTFSHEWPKPTRQVCPGSHQNPRNPESDGRPLWNGESNPHFYRNQSRHDPEHPCGSVQCAECFPQLGASYNASVQA